MNKSLFLVALLLLSGCDSSAPQASSTPLAQPAVEEGQAPLPPLLTPEQRENNVVFDVTLHDPADIALLLKRLDELETQPAAQGEQPHIALVLHGPEVEYFALKHYAENQELVDLAAKLSAFGRIEVKACQTRMRTLGLEDQDMPSFIELVPFGPDEVERLVGEDYLRM